MKDQIIGAIAGLWREFLASYGEAFGGALTLVSFMLALFAGVLTYLVRQSIIDVVGNPTLGQFNLIMMKSAGIFSIGGAAIGFFGNWLRRRGISEAHKKIIEDLESKRQIDQIISDYRHKKQQVALIEAVARKNDCSGC